MVLLGDVDHVESRSVHLEMVLVLVQDRSTVCSIYHLERTRWYSSVMKLNWKLVLVHLEIVLILMQDRCTVCAERTIGSEIILVAPDGTPRSRGSCGISFGPFGDGSCVSAR